MIIVINAQGKVLSQQNEDLFQGSIKANVIDLVAPFASNVTMYASFELPDGTYYEEKEMKHSIKVIDGLNVWKQELNFPVTKNYGIVTMQFRAVVGNQTICSGSAKIPIQKGVPYVKEDDLEPTQYEELKALISDVKALLGNKVEIATGQYELSSVNEDTVGTYYIYQDETDNYLPVVLPENYSQGVQYFELKKIGRVINDSKGVYLEYDDNGTKTTLKLTNDSVLINNDKIITDKTLIAQNVKYDPKYTHLTANNVQDALNELDNDLGEVKNSQVVDLGNHTLLASNWVASDGVYQYKFKHKLFTQAAVQGVIITPNAKAIDNLNNNDILIYPEIDIEQENQNVAVAIIKADKKPGFNIDVNIKLQGTTVDAKIEGLKANQIVFVPDNKITSETVQQAIEEVQGNLDEFETAYNTEKTGFAKLDVNGKIPASQLPAYVDDIIECYLHNAAMYLTRTGAGTEDDPYIYTNPVVAVSGKIYVDLQTNKQYRWSGTQYTIISESLALGETDDTAYSGAKGKANANAIAQLKANEGNATNINGLNIKSVNGVLKIGDIIIPQKKLIFDTYTEVESGTADCVFTETLNVGDVIEIEYGDTETTGFIKLRLANTSKTTDVVVESFAITIPTGTEFGFKTFEVTYDTTKVKFSNEKIITYDVVGDTAYNSETESKIYHYNVSTVTMFINKIYKIIE